MPKRLPTTTPMAHNLRDAARFLGISVPTLRRELKHIPHRRIGRRILISRDTLERYLANQD